MKNNLRLLAICFIGLAGATDLHSTVPQSFLLSSKDASAVVVASCIENDEERVRCEIVEVLQGAFDREQVLLEAELLPNPQKARQEYLLLLEQDGSLFRGPVTLNGLESLGCGLYNAIRLTNGEIVTHDRWYYDRKKEEALSLNSVRKDVAEAWDSR